jgi:oligopeptidase B
MVLKCLWFTKKGLKKTVKPIVALCVWFVWSYNGYVLSSTRLSILDRGFVFAIAHIRGGEDLGRQWYEDGKLLKRKILYGFHRLLKVN